MGAVEREMETVRELFAQIDTIEDVARTLDEERRQRLDSVVSALLQSAPPLRASVAAMLLSLSERTVRAWTAEGVFRPSPAASKRLLLDPERFHEVLHLVRDLRAAGTTKGLLDEVYRQLVDATWLDNDDLSESLAQMRRGEGRVSVAKPPA